MSKFKSIIKFIVKITLLSFAGLFGYQQIKQEKTDDFK